MTEQTYPPIQVVLLATAESQRLEPLTKNRPSPMLPIVNRPVMEVIIEQLARSGLKDILVCLHRLAGNIEKYFGDGRRWGVSLEYVLLREDWGNAGALRWAKSLISDVFLVLPADSMLDLDISVVMAAHIKQGHPATAIVHKICVGKPQQVCVDESNRIQGIIPLSDKENIYYETGAYIFDPQVFEYIPTRQKMDIHTDLLEKLRAEGHEVGAFVMDGYWNPFETYCEYHAAQSAYLYHAWGNGQASRDGFPLSEFPPKTRKLAPGIWAGRNTTIHPSVRFFPPVYLGDNVHLGRGVELGPEVVLGDEVFISDQATIRYSTIFPHTYVGQLVNLENRVVDRSLVIDADTAEAVSLTDPYLLSETPVSLQENFVHRLFDAFLAFIFLLLFIPVTLLISILELLLYGKVFQREPRLKTRPSQNPGSQAPKLEVFQMLHFRTRDEQGELTGLGKWLEKLEWHRLAELWNVITGDMRLVGVKPMTPAEADLLTEVWQKTHLEYYPGFTGLWDLQDHAESEPEETLIACTYYVATRTWTEDLQILIKAPQAWLNRFTKRGFNSRRYELKKEW